MSATNRLIFGCLALPVFLLLSATGIAQEGGPGAGGSQGYPQNYSIKNPSSYNYDRNIKPPILLGPYTVKDALTYYVNLVNRKFEIQKRIDSLSQENIFFNQLEGFMQEISALDVVLSTNLDEISRISKSDHDIKINFDKLNTNEKIDMINDYINILSNILMTNNFIGQFMFTDMSPGQSSIVDTDVLLNSLRNIRQKALSVKKELMDEMCLKDSDQKSERNNAIISFTEQEENISALIGDVQRTLTPIRRIGTVQNRSTRTIKIDDSQNIAPQLGQKIDSISRSFANFISVCDLNRLQIRKTINDFLSENAQDLNNLDQMLRFYNKSVADVQSDLKDNENEMTKSLSQMQSLAANEKDENQPIRGENIFAIFITLLAWCLVLYFVTSKLADARSGGGQIDSITFYLQVISVFILTGTVLILGLGNKLDKDTLSALIGAIAGYVLGQFKTNRSDVAAPPPTGQREPKPN